MNRRSNAATSTQARIALLFTVVLAAAIVGLVALLYRSDDVSEATTTFATSDPTAPGRVVVELTGNPKKVTRRPQPRKRTTQRPAQPRTTGGTERNQPRPQTARFHTVRKNDSLRGIARRYYGDASRWKDIQRANGLSGTVIRIDQRLRIP